MYDFEAQTSISFMDAMDRQMTRFKPCVISVEDCWVRSFDSDGNKYHEEKQKDNAFAVARGKVLKRQYREMNPDVPVTLVFKRGDNG